MAISDWNKSSKGDADYRIVPYFKGYHWRKADSERKAFRRTNMYLWEFIKSIGKEDECRQFLKYKRTQTDKK